MTMKTSVFYGLIAVLFIAMLVVSFRFFRGSAYSSVGVTMARPHTISSDRQATVTGVFVTPGQQVKQGDKLMTLVSTSLEVELDRLENRLEGLRAERSKKVKITESEIAYIQAQLDIELEEIESVITRTEAELELNKQLVKQYAGQPGYTSSTTPLEEKIRSYKRQLVMRQEARNIRIQDVRQRNQLELQLLDDQIGLLEREQEILLAEKNKLTKYAVADGVIDHINVKLNQQVEPFAPLLSVNPGNPTMVVGYLVGRKEAMPVGTVVQVKSVDYNHTLVSGKVIGYGSVVPLPEILQKSMAVKAFGREIFIELQEENAFAVGEKVLIR